ncbi:MAG: SDR family oxidoreductase, partial [Verrucomicrobiota bacterium]
MGSALVRQLQQEAAGELFGFCRTPGESAISLRSVDVANEDEVRSAVHEIQPTQIIHLAAAQTPYCNEHPLAGMRINAGGTAHLLQAAADLRSLERVVFASSAAVYGHRALYPWPTVHPDQELRPVNHYGRWKLAGEGMVRAFHEQTGVPCCMLRFATTFGPGRDLGLTSAGTSA